MFFNKKKKVLNELIDKFKSLITPEDEINCRELLDNREYLLCYNTLATQIYEYDRELTNEDYIFFKNTAEKLQLDAEEYKMLQQLIRDENHIPKPIKDNVAQIISNLKEDKKPH